MRSLLAHISLILLSLWTSVQLSGQNDSLLLVVPDSLEIDTLPDISTEKDSSAYVSPVDQVVTYPSRDSTVYDIKSQKVEMHGEAVVTYGDIILAADYILYDFRTMEVLAYGVPDSTGTVVGAPVFKQGDQEFSSDTIRYNFDSGKGLIKGVITNDGESYVHAERAKKLPNDQVHNYGGKYTTCSNREPHYHFRFNKMVVVPNDKIVTGPVYMKIGKIPTPLGLPFGFFPNTDKQKAGILFPEYGQSPQLGFFLINGGYYIPINDYWDTRLTGDIYSRGSWGLRNTSRYIKRYKYNGNIDLSYNRNLNGDPELDGFSRATNFFIRWNHSQNSKARPNTTFSANINAGTSNNFRNNLNSSQNDFISNTFGSGVNYSRRFKLGQITMSARHSQNTSTRAVNVTLPQVGFNLNRFYLPLSFLRGTNAVGGKKFYETIGVTYNSTFENRLSTTEPQLRLDNVPGLRKQIVNGMRHNVNANTSIKLGYLTLNPSFRLTERWHFKRTNEFVDQEGVFQTDTVNGFYATRDYGWSASMITKLYGMYGFRNKQIKAIRHVMTPNLSFNYGPELVYDERVLGDNTTTEGSTYNPYTVSAFSQSTPLRESASLSFNLQNNLEMKLRPSRKDTTAGEDRKIKLIENQTVSTSYNFIADSLNLSLINVSFRTTLFKGSQIQYSGTFDPYQATSEGVRVNRFQWNGKGPLLRDRNHRISLQLANLSGGQNERDRNALENDPLTFAEADREVFADDGIREEIANNPNAFVDFKLPWTLNLSYTLNINRSFINNQDQQRVDSTRVQQSVLFRGDIRILDKWKIGVNSGYDFTQMDWSATTVSLYWDLHCWEFQANVIPIGERKSYNLRIGVKASVLQDLKLQRRRTFGNGEGILF